MRVQPWSHGGFTILEVVLTLTITMALVAGLVPVMASTVRDARTARATADLAAMAIQLQTALTDMGLGYYTTTGTGGGTKVQLMVSDGDMPACTTAGAPCAGAGSSWNRLVNLGTVDFIENHLVANRPGGSVANDYSLAGGTPWRGPYLNAPIDPDPWGNRYMVNADRFNVIIPDTNALSAGPNETVETAWSGNPLVAGGDDLIVLVQP
jgi:type II secretory pathway pseudopilin PulG